MTKPRRNQKQKNKRCLSSPDGDQPEKRSAMNSNLSPPGCSGNQGTPLINNMASVAAQGYVQPLNMSNMNSYGNYQTQAGAFCNPQTQQSVPPPSTPIVTQVSPHYSTHFDQTTNFQQVVLARLDELGQKLGKLDSIEKQLTSLTQKVTSMDTRISSLESTSSETKEKLSQIENSRAFDSQILDEIRSSQSKIDRDLKCDRDRVEQLSRQCTQFQSLNDDILDLQSRSMRDNLLFMGFRECQTAEERRNENCVQTIHDFCENTLKIADAKSSIKIERAHRIGRFDSNKKRPIVVKFNHYPDKMLVKNRSYDNLKDSGFRVTEQYPKAIQDRRKPLLEAMRKARAAGKTASVSYDKLFIDGKKYTIDTLSASGFS